MKSVRCVVVLCFSLLAAMPAFAEGLASRMDVYVVKTDKQGDEDVVPSDTVEPGQLLEYRMHYHNQSDEPLRKLVITGPVPAATEYVEGSAQAMQGKPELEASFDGGNVFATPPLYRLVQDKDGTTRKETVPATDYTHIRWLIKEELKPGDQREYRYRVKVQ